MSELTWYGGGEWLYAPLRYTLCITEEEYLKEMQRLGIKYPPEFIPPDAKAVVHTFDYADPDKKFDGEGGPICFVCCKYYEDGSFVDHAALLVHESVHVFQKICETWNERSPSTEFQA